MRPIRIRVDHREEGTTSEYEFVNSPVRLGRNPLNDLPLPFKFVSGWHAVIRFDDERARFFDLGSTNGTEMGGRRIEAGETVPFEDAVTIQIGDLDLTLYRGDAAGFIPVGSAAGPADAHGRQWLQQPGSGHGRAGAIDTDDPAGLDALVAPRADQTAHVPMGQIHHSMAQLRPLYDEARHARLQFERSLREHVNMLPPHLREQAELYFRREFGDDLQDRPHGSTAAPSMAGVAGLAEQLLPDLPPPASDDEAEIFLACLRDVLEACAKGLVELQNGQEQFGQEMGVKAIKEFTPLHVAGSAADVLRYLLDWRHGGPHRLQELVGVFADLMIHQVALLNGVVEGSRAVLGRIDPDEIERLVGRGFGRKTGAKWQAYVTRFRELTSEQKLLTELLFGPEFARAYAEVGGEQISPKTQPPEPS